MDLSKTYPRSVHHKLAGMVQLGRTLDKARAHNAGTLGEYHYDCPMDQGLFGFLGTEHLEFAGKAAQLKDDAQFGRWIREKFLSAKTAAQIEDWNRAWAQFGPERGGRSERYFIELRNAIAPDRSDVTSWADLLDLEESRPVPRREKAA